MKQKKLLNEIAECQKRMGVEVDESIFIKEQLKRMNKTNKENVTPNYNDKEEQIIINIISEQFSDGTLAIKVPNGTDIKRILVIEDGTQYGRLYYPNEIEEWCYECLVDV